jgi:hypothetical protein
MEERRVQFHTIMAAINMRSFSVAITRDALQTDQVSLARPGEKRVVLSASFPPLVFSKSALWGQLFSARPKSATFCSSLVTAIATTSFVPVS